MVQSLYQTKELNDELHFRTNRRASLRPYRFTVKLLARRHHRSDPLHLDRDGVDSGDSSPGGEGMKLIDNEHLFRYSDPLQQELQLDVSEEDFDYDLMMKVDINHHLISEVFNERDLEVMLDSVGCIDHPA